MTDAVNKEIYYSPQIQTITTVYDSGVGNTSTSSVAAGKYLYHQKPKSVKGTKVNNSNFRLPTGWSMVHRDQDLYLRGMLAYRHDNNKTVTYWGRLPFPTGSNTFTFPAKVYARAELDALLKLKDEKVSVGVSLGERKQVAGMFQDNLTRVAKAYRSARKGNFKVAARQLGLSWKDVPNKWLELQYGWKPLLSDVYTAVEELNKSDREDPTRTWLHVTGMASDNAREITTVATSFNGVQQRSVDARTHEAKVRFDFKPNAEMGLQKTLDQWGISNPLQIAWELIPFSFVVDWALPIGDYLAAMGAGKPYDFLCGSQSRFTKSTRRSFLIFDPSKKVWGSGESSAVRTEFYRYLYYSFPRPDARALLASSNPSQQTIANRVANALSILSTSCR